MTATDTTRRDALIERLFGAALGTFDLYAAYLGERLGLYRALADAGELTSSGLAEACGIHERYAREWLEQQAASGILDVHDASAPAEKRRFSLPAGHEEVLTDTGSLSFMTPMALLVMACARPIDALLEAFRTGDGVPYADYGADLHEGQAGFTGPIFAQHVVEEWLPAIDDVHARLLDETPARVADVACGLGRLGRAVAQAYPNVLVDGIDLDAASIAAARAELQGSGLEERVTFTTRDAADPALSGRYDLVLIFEALHDMSYPVDALAACRGLLTPGGSVIVVDERTEERFTAPASELEQLFYGFSIMHCLPVGMIGDGAAGTGTVMRPDTVEAYARAAGFTSFEVLPIEHDVFRLYRLRS
jgi:2-polyprenyl-3-methyl-5-hydroxy-6-metoxy-1,4-benzoquinol methylase